MIRRSRFFVEPETVYLRVSLDLRFHDLVDRGSDSNQVRDGDKHEEHLFRIHRYFLERDSELFRGMFACPPTKGSIEGQTEETAIHLPGVVPYELECLMAFLYEG